MTVSRGGRAAPPAGSSWLPVLYLTCGDEGAGFSGRRLLRAQFRDVSEGQQTPVKKYSAFRVAVKGINQSPGPQWIRSNACKALVFW